MAFIEVWEDYALLLKGTSWGSESSVKPLAVLTRITCDKRTPSSYGSASVFRIRMLIILKYKKFWEGLRSLSDDYVQMGIIHMIIVEDKDSR